MDNHTLLLIDGFNLLSRGYFATSYGRSDDQLSKTKDGVYTNALRVFIPKLFSLIREHEVSHVAITWDVKREETDRRIKYDFYKATRGELPMPLIEQFLTLKTVLEEIGIAQLEMSPYEADDLIGTLSNKWSHSIQNKCYIYSNDRDLLQLLNEHTSQIIAQKTGEIIYSIEHFNNDYGIHPKQWVDVKALLGDSSDNIPGCPGVGEKSAIPLIQQYQSVEELYENMENLDPKFNRYKKKLIAGKDSTIISKELSAIMIDIPHFEDYTFEDLKLSINEDNLTNKLQELEIRIRR
ncbi:5'-3' exonuclease [Gottfriedia solisilvae]|uniref:5'-3' exonuclease n=1 Tax=Gottfriedia solisilvae TaxID=1516104 RepID=A0A8J3AI88_9BACI|nr:5'-3' exonuclease H3TH domain-containing protein [Gottfriedia solisilvae]GGI13883.1 5'-3' exonuclease [Gottfriedia solisilvae]